MCEANRHSTPDGVVSHNRSRGPAENLPNVQAKVLESRGSHINQKYVCVIFRGSII